MSHIACTKALGRENLNLLAHRSKWGLSTIKRLLTIYDLIQLRLFNSSAASINSMQNIAIGVRFPLNVEAIHISNDVRNSTKASEDCFKQICSNHRSKGFFREVSLKLVSGKSFQATDEPPFFLSFISRSVEMQKGGFAARRSRSTSLSTCFKVGFLGNVEAMRGSQTIERRKTERTIQPALFLRNIGQRRGRKRKKMHYAEW